jgi:AraC family transcriptional regulator
VGTVGTVATSHTHIYVWDRLLFSAGPGRENVLHRHFGAILAIAADAPAFVAGATVELTTHAVLVAPNAMHRIDCVGGRVITVLIGPDHPWFCYVKPLLTGNPIVGLDVSRIDRSIALNEALFTGEAPCPIARGALEHVLTTFGGTEVEPHRLDPRIENALKLLNEDIAHPPRLPDLGRRVGLSAFTLMRRFKRELGVRIGEYVLWRRMMSGLTLVDGRTTVADIAQLTGFYDQAHLTRTVRRMVSLAPSFINDMSQTRIHVCGDLAQR